MSQYLLKPSSLNYEVPYTTPIFYDVPLMSVYTENLHTLRMMERCLKTIYFKSFTETSICIFGLYCQIVIVIIIEIFNRLCGKIYTSHDQQNCVSLLVQR